MKKLPQAGRFADVLHKSFVTTCVGVTLFGMLFVGERIHNYFTVIKPTRLEERKQLEPKENTDLETEVADIAETLKL